MLYSANLPSLHAWPLMSAQPRTAIWLPRVESRMTAIGCASGSLLANQGRPRLTVPGAASEVSLLSTIRKPYGLEFLVLGAKARAILAGRYHVDFADIRAMAAPVLRHRLVLNFHARADGLDTDKMIERLLKLVPEEG